MPDKKVILAAVIVLVILFAVALYGFLTGRWEDGNDESSLDFRLASGESRPVQLSQNVYEGIPPDSHLLALDRAALEEAYRMRLIRLFDVWLSSNQAQDATNFINGLKIARRGYSLATAALSKREVEIK